MFTEKSNAILSSARNNLAHRIRIHKYLIQESMDRNSLFRTIHIALNLRDSDAVRLMEAGGMPISRSAAQDMKRRFNPDNPRKSRRVYEEHLLALLDGIESEAGQGKLPIEPQDTLMEVLRSIRQAIGSGENWPLYGRALEERMELEISRHRD